MRDSEVGAIMEINATPELPELLCAAFSRLMPLYDFFMEIYETSREGEKSV